MSRCGFYDGTCARCGFPFAGREAYIFGASHNYITTCGRCGFCSFTHINALDDTATHEFSIDITSIKSTPVPDASSAWGTFTCRECGGQGVIVQDEPLDLPKRLTTYCPECEQWSRWYWDQRQGTF